MCVHGGRLSAWQPQIARAKNLLKDSYTILAGLAAMVYMRIDQIMLGQMLGADAVKLYIPLQLVLVKYGILFQRLSLLHFRQRLLMRKRNVNWLIEI